MLSLRSVDTPRVMSDNESHRSLWTERKSPHHNTDGSGSWKGCTATTNISSRCVSTWTIQPRVTSRVRGEVIPDHRWSKLRKTSEVRRRIISRDCCLPVQEQKEAKSILEEPLPQNRHMVGEKLLLADVTVYEYHVEGNASSGGRIFLADPDPPLSWRPSACAKPPSGLRCQCRSAGCSFYFYLLAGYLLQRTFNCSGT